MNPLDPPLNMSGLLVAKNKGNQTHWSEMYTLLSTLCVVQSTTGVGIGGGQKGVWYGPE